MPDHPIGPLGEQELRLVGGECDGEAAPPRGPDGPAIEAGRGEIEEQCQDESFGQRADPAGDPWRAAAR